MPKGVYERKAKALTVETGNEIERQEELAPDLPQAQPVAVEPQWEACKVCGGDHWTKDHVSPTPRARPKPEDDRAQWNAAMRVKAESMYRAMQRGEVVPISPDTIDVVQWLRQHGVRVRAVVSGGSTIYELSDIQKSRDMQRG